MGCDNHDDSPVCNDCVRYQPVFANGNDCEKPIRCVGGSRPDRKLRQLYCLLADGNTERYAHRQVWLQEDRFAGADSGNDRSCV